MPLTFFQSGVGRHHKSLETVRAGRANVDLKNLAERQIVGRIVARTFQLASWDQKAAWVTFGHRDGAQVSRWIAGTERVQLDTLIAAGLLPPFLLACAEVSGSSVAVTTQITVTRSA